MKCLSYSNEIVKIKFVPGHIYKTGKPKTVIKRVGVKDIIMKQHSTFSILVTICLYHILTAASCKPDPIEPPIVSKSIAELVAGNYTGDAKYMPFLSTPLDLPSGSTSCYIPEWASYLKTGTASAAISLIDDSTINLILVGSVYSSGFNKNFILSKNGNIVADATNSIKFNIDSKLLQLSFQIPNTIKLADCIPVSKYYFARKNSTLRYYCYAIETWEFSGIK